MPIRDAPKDNKGMKMAGTDAMSTDCRFNSLIRNKRTEGERGERAGLRGWCSIQVQTAMY